MNYYIRNIKTDQNYDTIEQKFYNNNWEPQLESERSVLENIMEWDPETFKNCIIEEV
jgi:hypothetical protein